MKHLRILLSILLICLIVAQCTATLAEPVYVAEVAGTKYTQFNDAVNAAINGSDKTITVIGEVGDYSFSSKNMTGVTIQGSSTGKITGTWTVTGNSTVFTNATIQNLNFVGGNIVFSTATKSFENFTIDNCVFNGPSNTSSKPAIQLQKASGVSVDGLKITNNTIDHYTGAGILLNGGGGSGCTVTISGNSISNVSSNGIQALSIENLLIKDNTLSNTGSVFNLYGTQNASFENNRVTLQSATQNVLIYVSGMIEFDSSNSVQYSGSEVELTSANCNPGDATWDDIRMVAVQAGKNSNGQYVSGHFVGLESTIAAKLADGVNYSGSEYDWEITVPEATPTIQPTVSPTNTPVPSVPSAPPAPPAPKTGDDSHIFLWMTCLLISSVAIFRLCCIRRARKDKF